MALYNYYNIINMQITACCCLNFHYLQNVVIESGQDLRKMKISLIFPPTPVYPKFEVSVLGAYLKVYDIQYVFLILNFLLIISNKYCKILEAYIIAFKICTVFT